MKVIVILKGKLFTPDNVFPVLVAIKRLHPSFSPLIIVPSEADANLILNNPALARGLDLMNAKLRHYVPVAHASIVPGEHVLIGRPAWRVLARLRNNLLLRHMIMTKVVLFESSASRNTTYLHKINRFLFGGRRVFIGINNIPDAALENQRSERIAQKRPPVRFAFPWADAVIVSRSAASAHGQPLIQVPSNMDVVEVGYSRGLEAWTNILELDSDVVQQEITEDFVFFPLSVLFRSEDQGGTPGGLRIDELVIEILEVLDTFANRLKIVMRYHPTTDRNRMAEIVRDLNLRNYAFSDHHPISLIRTAKLVIMAGSSTLAYDAHYWNRPVIEYCQFDPIQAQIGFKSRNEGIVDYVIHRDKPRLKVAIDEILARPRSTSVAAAKDRDRASLESTDADLKAKILPLLC